MEFLQFVFEKGYVPSNETLSEVMAAAMNRHPLLLSTRAIDVVLLDRKAPFWSIELKKKRPVLSLLPVVTFTDILSEGNVDTIKSIIVGLIADSQNGGNHPFPVSLSPCYMRLMESAELHGSISTRSAHESETIRSFFPESIVFDYIARDTVAAPIPSRIRHFLHLFNFLAWGLYYLEKEGNCRWIRDALEGTSPWKEFISLSEDHDMCTLGVTFDGRSYFIKGRDNMVTLFMGMSTYFNFD